MIILRLFYKKEKLMKFISHLDMVRLMERTFRRAKFPLEFSNGFNPHPKINYALPLSVGYSSECEVLDVKLKEKIDIDKFIENQKKYVPEGIEFISGKFIEETKSLMSLVEYAEYIIAFPIDKNYKEKILNYLDNDEIIIEKLNKKKVLKKVDIKPLIIKFSVDIDNEEKLVKLNILAKSGSNGNLNPMILINELIKKLGMNIDKTDVRVHKKNTYSTKEGKMINIFDL